MFFIEHLPKELQQQKKNLLSAYEETKQKKKELCGELKKQNIVYTLTM